MEVSVHGICFPLSVISQVKEEEEGDPGEVRNGMMLVYNDLVGGFQAV